MIYVRVFFKESTHDRALSVWGACLAPMTAYEIISIFIGILALLMSFGSLIIALLAFLDKEKSSSRKSRRKNKNAYPVCRPCNDDSGCCNQIWPPDAGIIKRYFRVPALQAVAGGASCLKMLPVSAES